MHRKTINIERTSVQKRSTTSPWSDPRGPACVQRPAWSADVLPVEASVDQNILFLRRKVQCWSADLHEFNGHDPMHTCTVLLCQIHTETIAPTPTYMDRRNK